jgi:hypothetical protein
MSRRVPSSRFDDRRAHALAFACVVAAWFYAASAARADQPRDFMLSIQPPGTFLLLDYFGTGAQATLENRIKIYRDANDLTTGVSLVPAYPLAEANARADLRILFFSLGGTVAYRSVWRDLSFAPGKNSYCADCDRGARRSKDAFFGKSPGSDQFGYAEVRARLLFPFNDYVVMDMNGALRYEGRNDRSFDWFYTTIYDHGVLGRFEVDLFAKHRNWGGIGPYLQLLELPRDGGHQAQWAFGFNAVTRLGLLKRNDLLFLTFLIRPGDAMYGQHNYYAPVRSLLVYRMIIDL